MGELAHNLATALVNLDREQVGMLRAVMKRWLERGIDDSTKGADDQ
jgi:hypothetical protein